MMASPTELSLNCKPNVHSMLSRSYEEHGNATGQMQKLQEFVARLEEERLKIAAFERELPLCVQLLTNVMDSSRQELESQSKSQAARPVLEEFIPLKPATLSENELNLSLDKANWMTSSQLWHQEIKGTNPLPRSHLLASDPILALYSQPGIQSQNGTNDIVSPSPGAAFPELALSSSPEGLTEDNKESSEAISGRNKSGTCRNIPVNCGAANARKERRSWSPDLHRRFVDALQMLGGSHVATPRQIRELMKVDGLTNDEVKSHLQKYRLHASPSRRGAVISLRGQVVVLRGIWVPPEYAAAGHRECIMLPPAPPEKHRKLVEG